MYTPKEQQKPGNGAGKTGDQTQPNQRPDSDDVKQISTDDVIKATPNPRPKDDAKPPLHAAEGNDEVMSQPPQKTS